MEEITKYRKELRGKIIQYALQEFYQRGVKSVKMDEISQGMHISKRTVYEIFGDKEELLLAGLKKRMVEKRMRIEQYAQEHARNVIDIIGFSYREQMESNQKISATFLDDIHKMPRVVQFLQDIHASEHDDTMKFFEAGVEEGVFRDDINYEVVMNLGEVCMESIMENQLYKKYSVNDLFTNYFLVTTRGFCTEQGLVQLNKVMREFKAQA